MMNKLSWLEMLMHCAMRERCSLQRNYGQCNKGADVYMTCILLSAAVYKVAFADREQQIYSD